MPLMLKNYKAQQNMKIKMDALRPEMEDIQKRLKEAKEKEQKDEQMKLQQEMMGLYSKHGVNPLNMGCLPLIIQMPIIMGLYFAILNSPEVQSHEFLWFNLGEPDMIMMVLAGAVYFVQARVSLWTMPETAAETDESVHLLVADYDYVHFIQSDGSVTSLLGCWRTSPYLPNVLGPQVLLQAS